MNATQFARRRGRIEHQGARTHGWRTKAMRQLVNEAQATTVTVGGKQTGWLLPNGETVCIKTRFRTEPAATAQLTMIEHTDGIRAKRPVRAYPCRYCGGWHVTSQAQATNEDDNHALPRMQEEENEGAGNAGSRG